MICQECNRDLKKYAKGLCNTCYDRKNRTRGVCTECKGETCRPCYKLCTPCANRVSPKHLGHTHSPGTRQKIRENTPVRRREKHSMWKGGITGWQRLIRQSVEGKKWIKQVFERDDYTCQACGERGGELHADHVMPFSLFPELRFDLLNGRALCVKCHRKTFLTKELRRQLLGFQLP